MHSYLLKFFDKTLESTFQKDLKFAKILNFHYFLILELSMVFFLTFFNLIYQGISFERLTGFFLSIFFMITIIILSKKLRDWKHLLATQIIIHFILIVTGIEMVKNGVKQENERIFEIVGVPFHIGFICILLTRFHWILLGIFDLFFNIFYIVRVFSLQDIIDYPMTICLYFINVVGFCCMVFYQEKTTRIFYKTIYESNQNSLQFQLLLKNIIPSPIFIVDFENEKIKFFNNAAFEFIHGFENELMQTFQEENYFIERNDSYIEKDNFRRFLNTIKILKLSNDNNGSTLIENLLIYDKKPGIEIVDNSNCDFESKFIFEESNVFLNENDLLHLNLSPTSNKVARKFFNVKYLKMKWQNKKSMLVILHDITQLHNLEELKHLDDYKNKLLATVSHDLRTPINGMMGMIEMVLPKLTEKKDIKNLTVALRSGQLLMNMINDILDFSQINNKKLRLDFQNVDLVSILKETAKLIKFRIKLKGLKFINEFSKIKNIFINSDATRIKQIVLNLLTNALKFTNIGYIKLKLEEETFNQNEFYKISVEDTGIGIKEDDQDKLFKLFGKLNLESKDLNKTGVGLGLTISKNLAKILNNFESEGIYLISEWGKGSIFWFYLPKNRKNSFELSSIADEKAETIDPIRQKNGKSNENQYKNYKYRILFVDDDLVNLMVGKCYCEFFKMECITANDDSEAIDIVQKVVCKENKSIDAIFMDFNMPIIDGLNAAEEIYRNLKENGKKEIPIIIMSAGIYKNLSPIQESAIKLCLNKPLSKAKFEEIITKYIKINIQ